MYFTFQNIGCLFIGPESDHWLCLSVTPSLTHSLTHCCLVNLMALYDPNYLMMSQQLLNVFYDVKSFAKCWEYFYQSPNPRH